MSLTHKLTQSEIDIIIVIQRTLENRIQGVGKKESFWIFQRINTMGISFYKSGELNGSSYVKIPLRSSVLVNIKNDDKNCFNWSILASLHPCESGNPNRVSNYKQYFNELNINGFDFSNGFECSDMHKFEKLKNLSINKFEKNFYQARNKWKHKLIPIEICIKGSDRAIDLINYKNLYVLINKSKVFLGKHDCRHFCN